MCLVRMAKEIQTEGGGEEEKEVTGEGQKKRSRNAGEKGRKTRREI